MSRRSDRSWNWKHTEEQPLLPQRLQRLWRRAVNTDAVKRHRHPSAVFYSHTYTKIYLRFSNNQSSRCSTQGSFCAKCLFAFNVFRIEILFFYIQWNVTQTHCSYILACANLLYVTLKVSLSLNCNEPCIDVFIDLSIKDFGKRFFT